MASALRDREWRSTRAIRRGAEPLCGSWTAGAGTRGYNGIHGPENDAVGLQALE